MKIEREYYTPTQMGYIFGVSAPVIQKWINSTLIPVVRCGKTFKLHKDQMNNVRYLVALKSLNKSELIKRVYQADTLVDRLEAKVKDLERFKLRYERLKDLQD